MRERDMMQAMACFIAAALAIIFLVRDCRRREACEDRGGTVERYNFRTVMVPTSCGSGCTILVPQQVSDWRCVGGRAEAE